MTAAAYTHDFSLISGFESTTSMNAYGGGASGLGASPDYKIQGTNAVDKQINNTEKGFMYDAGGIGLPYEWIHGHFFIWIVCSVPGLTDTRDNRGIHVAIGDGTSDFVKFHVNGGDTKPRGGIAPYAIRFDNTALANRRTLVGSPGTTPDHIGGGANTTGTAKFSNLACDYANMGTGYTATGGTSPDAAANFDGLNTQVANPIFSLVDGAFQWQGKIRIGASGVECRFTDSNQSIFVVNTLDGHVNTDLNEFIVSDDSTVLTLTNVTFTALGTHSPGRFETVTPLVNAQDETSYDNSPSTEGTFNGGTSYAVGDDIYMDDGYTIVTVDAVSSGVVTQFTVDGQLSRATAGTTLNQHAAFTSLGGTSSGTGFTLTPDVDNIVDYGTCNLTNVGFVGFGDCIFSANDTLLGCRWINSDQVTANGATMTDSTFVGYEGTANTSYLIWDVNSDPDTYLDGSAFTKGTAATHAIEFGTSIPSDITLRNCDFTDYNASNGQNDSTFHFLDTGGTITLNLTNCTGNFSYRTEGATILIVEDPVDLTINVADVTNGLAVETARVFVQADERDGDSYEDTNPSSQNIGNITVDCGQSFTADFSSGLASVTAQVRVSAGSPTGNVVARLWTHSGTFGTNSVGDTLIATSETAIDVTTLTGTFAEYKFVFDGTKALLTEGENYFVTIFYDNGDASNLLAVGFDATGSHAGNLATRSTTPSWTANGSADMPFKITEGLLPVNVPCTITRSGSTATVAFTAHPYDVGDKVLIEGANQDEYNGVRTITAVATNTFDYTVSGTPTTPATGDITNTYILISENTPASGSVTINRSYTADQPISGRVRRSSTSPLYKSQPLIGLIPQKTGLTINAQLIPDE